MTIQDIMNKWAEVCEYDTNRTSFTLGTYELHRAGKLAEKILTEYDDSGKLSLMVLKKAFIDQMSDAKVKMIDLLRNRNEYHNYFELYDLLYSKDVLDAEDAVSRTVGSMYKNITGTALLADNRKEIDITNKIGVLIEDIEKLRMETYIVGYDKIHIEKMSKDILIFNTLAEAIVTLEQDKVSDGTYVCYINMNNSNDSYFAIILKSNGWIASWNDRIDERYPGQHRRLSQRNGRWAEDKRDNIFPYDSLLVYDNHDYKGYATTFRIRDEYINEHGVRAVKISKLMQYDGDVNLILGLIFWKIKFQGKALNEKVVYSNVLLEMHDGILTDSKDEKSLMCLNAQMIKKSKYAQRNRDIDINLDSDSVKNPEIIGLNYECTDMIMKYGHDFELRNTGFKETEKLMIGNYEGLLDPEYIGDENTLKKADMYLARKQLADKIHSNIEKELKEAGGEDEVHNEISKLLKNNIPNILIEIKKHFSLIGNENIYKRYDDKDLSIIRTDIKEHPLWIRRSEELNKLRNGKEVCPITEAIATIRFSIEIKTLDGLKRLIENKEDIPKVMDLMNIRGHGGNPLLDMIDPVELIRSPFESKFKCTLCLSKRGYSKLMSI